MMNHIKHIPYQIQPDDNRFHFYETLWKRIALELLTKHEPNLSEWSLLDYGCGRGETLEMAKRVGMEVKGVDMDPECVRLSCAHGPSEVLNLKDPVGQIGTKSHDVVACFHVLEHVPSPIETLQHLSRIARRYVLLAVPNGGLMPDIVRPARNCRDINEGHLQCWDHSHLKSLAERHCGLSLVEWGFDHVIVPLVSGTIARILGEKVTLRLESGLFRRLFPYQSTSVIGLFRVKDDDPSNTGENNPTDAAKEI